jgi:hypothetical protein
MTFVDLWRRSGTIDRRTYALVGILGFASTTLWRRVVATRAFVVLGGASTVASASDVVRITNLPRYKITVSGPPHIGGCGPMRDVVFIAFA